MKPVLNTSSGHFASIATGYLWDKSMCAGLISDCAAKNLHEDRFHAYLASLTMQSGMTMLSRELDNHFTSETVPSDREFVDQLNRYALEISCLISQHWKFPAAVTSALQEQVNNDDPSKMSKLGAIIYLSDKLAKIHLLTKKGYLKTVDTDITKRMPPAMARVFSDCLNVIEEE
jgi:HD-like signal output (HDOD) protein